MTFLEESSLEISVVFQKSRCILMRLISTSDGCESEIVFRSCAYQIKRFDLCVFRRVLDVRGVCGTVLEIAAWGTFCIRFHADIQRASDAVVCGSRAASIRDGWDVPVLQDDRELRKLRVRGHAHGAGTNGRAMPEAVNGVVFFCPNSFTRFGNISSRICAHLNPCFPVLFSPR